ncbi:MAG: multidrug effflux MFS transporter [Pigmentiphaga sp.]
MKAPWMFIGMLILVAAVSPLGINLYLPSMPEMARALQVDFAAVQVSLSVYLAAVAVGQLVVGPLSDHYGRRPVLLGGLGLFVLGSVLCTIAPDTLVLNLGRIVQGFGGCAGIALSRAIVRDLYDRQRAASMIGYVSMGMAVAPMLAPAIGGVLEASFGWRASFAFLGGFGLLTLLVVFFLLHETLPAKREAAKPAPADSQNTASRLLAGYALLLRSRPFWGYAMATSFTSGVFYAFIAGAAYVMIELMGRSPVEYGIYFTLVALGYIVGNFVSARFGPRFGHGRLIRVGLGMAPACIVAMAVFFAWGWLHPLALFGPMFVLGVGNGLVMPGCIAGAVSVRPEAAGAASGLAGSLQVGLGALIAPLVGAIMGSSVWPLVAVMMASAILAAMVFRLTRRSTS